MRRDHGRSVKEIARILGVSRSSVSLWVRDVELTATQRAALRARNPRYNAQVKGAAANAVRARARREAAQLAGRALARRGDALHAAGCMLYWAEGDKQRHAVRLTNSDPELVSFFLSFLRSSFAVPDERVRVACNLFADHLRRQSEIEDFWLELLRLPRSCLSRSRVNVYSKYSQKKRRGKLPYGTCRLTVHDTTVVQSI